MNDNETKECPIDRFLQWIADLVRRDDRGTLAELRRGLSPTTREQCWPHIIRFAKSDFENETLRTVWCSIGGLAALMIPKGFVTDDDNDNLGTTMQKLAFKAMPTTNGQRESKEKALKDFSPRLRRILDALDSIPLCEMAVRIVRMAASKDVPVNLRNLFLNLCSWDNAENREKTRLKWTRRYYTIFEPRTDVNPDQMENGV